MKTNQQNKEWEDEFDEKFTPKLNLGIPRINDLIVQHNEEIKQFIHTTRQEAKQQARDEIVEMIEEGLDKPEPLEYHPAKDAQTYEMERHGQTLRAGAYQARNDIINKIKEL